MILREHDRLIQLHAARVRRWEEREDGSDVTVLCDRQESEAAQSLLAAPRRRGRCVSCQRMIDELSFNSVIRCRCRTTVQFCSRCGTWLPQFAGYLHPKRCDACGPVALPLRPATPRQWRKAPPRRGAHPLVNFTSGHFHLIDKHRERLLQEEAGIQALASGKRKIAAWERMERQRRSIPTCPPVW